MTRSSDQDEGEREREGLSAYIRGPLLSLNWHLFSAECAVLFGKKKERKKTTHERTKNLAKLAKMLTKGEPIM